MSKDKQKPQFSPVQIPTQTNALCYVFIARIVLAKSPDKQIFFFFSYFSSSRMSFVQFSNVYSSHYVFSFLLQYISYFVIDFNHQQIGLIQIIQKKTKFFSLSLFHSLIFILLQSKCSIFRGVLLCLCLNITYGNVVRFPREVERHGIIFLIPYVTMLLFIGLPITLFEVALGQFLGQGSAHSWRASPIFRGKYLHILYTFYPSDYMHIDDIAFFVIGASLIGRFASWLGTIWISMQAAVALVYIGELCANIVPFEKCSRVDRDQNVSNNHFQYSTFDTNFRKFLYSSCRLDIIMWESLDKSAYSEYFSLFFMRVRFLIQMHVIHTNSRSTLLSPVWETPTAYAFLTVSLIVLWTVAAVW